MSGARIKGRVIYAAEIQNNHYLSVHIKKLTKKMRRRALECVHGLCLNVREKEGECERERDREKLIKDL